LKILPKYPKKGRPFSLRGALSDCVLDGTERGKSYIYRTYYGYAMAVVLRYVPAGVEAEEIVNESFVKAFRKVGTFEMHAEDAVLEKTFKAWLARIAVNTSIDVLRARKPTDMLEDVPEADLKEHAVLMADSLGVQDILKLLDGIPPLQRSIFNLFEIEGYSHEEIGRMLGIPEATSRTYLTRAKCRLRKLYREEFGEPNIAK